MGSWPALTTGHFKADFNPGLLCPEWTEQVWPGRFTAQSLKTFSHC